jgi:hypothetical protein
VEKYFASRSLRNHSVQFDFVSHGEYLRRAMADHLDVIAGDHGGNAFCTTKDGAVWFWAATSQVRSKEGEIRVH